MSRVAQPGIKIAIRKNEINAICISLHLVAEILAKVTLRKNTIQS